MRTSKSRAVWSQAGVSFDISKDVLTALVLVDCIDFVAVHHDMSWANVIPVSFSLGWREEWSGFHRWLESISILWLGALFVWANWYQEHACQTHSWHSTPVASRLRAALCILSYETSSTIYVRGYRKEVKGEKVLMVHLIHSQNYYLFFLKALYG